MKTNINDFFVSLQVINGDSISIKWSIKLINEMENLIKAEKHAYNRIGAYKRNLIQNFNSYFDSLLHIQNESYVATHPLC